MNKNRIEGASFRTSGHMTAKSISIKGTGRKSGGRALKVIELTRGDLRRVSLARLRGTSLLTAAQRSAEGIVGHPAEGPNGPRKGLIGAASRTRDSWT